MTEGPGQPTLEREIFTNQHSLAQLQEKHDYEIATGQLDLARKTQADMNALETRIQNWQEQLTRMQTSGYMDTGALTEEARRNRADEEARARAQGWEEKSGAAELTGFYEGALTEEARQNRALEAIDIGNVTGVYTNPETGERMTTQQAREFAASHGLEVTQVMGVDEQGRMTDAAQEWRTNAALDYAKTAAQLQANPGDYFESAAFMRGAQASGVPAFLEQINQGGMSSNMGFRSAATGLPSVGSMEQIAGGPGTPGAAPGTGSVLQHGTGVPSTYRPPTSGGMIQNPAAVQQFYDTIAQQTGPGGVGVQKWLESVTSSLKDPNLPPEKRAEFENAYNFYSQTQVNYNPTTGLYRDPNYTPYMKAQGLEYGQPLPDEPHMSTGEIPGINEGRGRLPSGPYNKEFESGPAPGIGLPKAPPALAPSFTRDYESGPYTSEPPPIFRPEDEQLYTTQADNFQLQQSPNLNRRLSSYGSPDSMVSAEPLTPSEQSGGFGATTDTSGGFGTPESTKISKYQIGDTITGLNDERSIGLPTAPSGPYMPSPVIQETMPQMPRMYEQVMLNTGTALPKSGPYIAPTGPTGIPRSEGPSPSLTEAQAADNGAKVAYTTQMNTPMPASLAQTMGAQGGMQANPAGARATARGYVFNPATQQWQAPPRPQPTLTAAPNAGYQATPMAFDQMFADRAWNPTMGAKVQRQIYTPPVAGGDIAQQRLAAFRPTFQRGAHKLAPGAYEAMSPTERALFGSAARASGLRPEDWEESYKRSRLQTDMSALRA
jgi:hypothetical protein